MDEQVKKELEAVGSAENQEQLDFFQKQLKLLGIICSTDTQITKQKLSTDLQKALKVKFTEIQRANTQLDAQVLLNHLEIGLKLKEDYENSLEEARKP